MKKLFFYSIVILLVLEFIQVHFNVELPDIVLTLAALGVWVGGLGWLWKRFRFVRPEDRFRGK